MITTANKQMNQWQDFKVRSEADVVLELAHRKGWKDCEIFGHGAMIDQPLESMGWKLIPADKYEYSIPAEGASRVMQVINAGVRVQGVIIADDGKRAKPVPQPARPQRSAPSLEKVLTFLAMLIMGLSVAAFFVFLAPLILLFSIIPLAVGTDYDPKLVILVDDGAGGTLWVSLLTWFD
jgi:hypothetical protein